MGIPLELLSLGFGAFRSYAGPEPPSFVPSKVIKLIEARVREFKQGSFWPFSKLVHEPTKIARLSKIGSDEIRM